jgi:hypothetical protein
MGQLSLVRSVYNLKWATEVIMNIIVGRETRMKTTDRVVCISLIGVIAEPAHYFNTICVMCDV